MLTVINRYTHGYVAVPVILACKSLGLFSCLEGKRLALDDISAVLKGTSGFLFVALRLLESMQWIERDSAGRYALCTLGQRELANVPEDVTTLFDFPFDAYLAGDQRDPGGPSEGALTLAGWVDRSLRNWDSSDPLVPYLLDGMLIIPLLLGLQRSPAYDAHARSLRFEQLSEPARTQVLRLFGHKGWCEDASGAPALTDIGKFMLQRSMNAGTVVSYTPMLRQIGSLLAGDPASVFRQDEEGHELHVERTLNVVSSGFQHERYFRSMDEIFGAIFNQLPVEDQPRYIADVGCGDGTLLRRVHTLLRDTERGKVLDQYPLTLIGVDFNDKALAATAATLHDIDHMVLHGDIGNPSQIEADLARHIEEVDKVLYIRSFLDHDRPFIAPSDQAAIAAREDVGYECVSVAPSGALIPPAVAVQSLVEHLARWARVRTRYGIVILEVHSLPAATTARYLAESENLHFDAYHAFSKQHLVEAPTFLACAAEAGLVFDSAAAKKYPAVFPYTRITLNYFRPKAYRIRMAGAGDLDSLVALERHVPAQWRCDASGIAQRIHAWREGQMVLELDGKVAAAVYARRRSPQQAAWHDAPRPWQHDATGAVVELAYVVGPGAHLRGELLAFMEGYSRTMNGVEQVAGAGACLEFGDETHDTSDTLAQCVASAAERFAASHPIRPEHDTLPAETVLEDFGARWLLGILQARGVLQHPGQCYASADAIGQQIGVLPKYRLLFASLIGIFERKGVLVRTSAGLETTARIEGFALADGARDYPEFSRAFRAAHPDSVPFMTLMATCLASYGEVLTGAREATDVVFPQGSMDLFAGIFKDAKVADYFNELVAELVHASLAFHQRSGAPGKLRILEIGAGTGGVTRFVLERLGRNSDAVSFHYTDISSTFLRHGQRSFGAQYPCLVFERLNIEHDPVEQGFEAGGFDLVFASNVLHDTRYLDNTLAQVGKLLRPDGLLILNEFTVMKDLLLYTGGLLHGWWLFQDPEHRLSNSCLLGVSHWKAILEKSGWGDFTAFGLPFEQDLAQCRQSVMFCTRAAGAQAQAMPLAQSVAQAAAGPASAPASEPLLDLVMDSIGEIIGAKRLAAFEPATPLMEQGVDSLELVELNALLGKKTGLRLETSFLFQFNTAEKLSRHFRARLGAAAPEPAPAPAPAEDPALRAGVEAIIAKLIGARRMNGFTPELPLMELGIDSLELLELRTLLGQQFGVELNASFLFQYNTCAKIAAYLDKRPALQPSPAAPPVEVDAADVAIVGMALRFPGKASDPDSFWQLLTTGTSAIGALAPERLDWPAQVDVAGDKAYLTRGGFLDRIDEFDAPFFRISPMEAELMDPQQRMLLELVWGALEDAGHKPSALAGPATGVYVGACHFEYRSLLERSGTSQGAFVATGSSASILANRISYFYDFQGPSVLVDTACSSSLVAVHQAVRDLRDGACRQALVGGVNLICNTVNVLAYDHAGMLSADSRCATFDAGANGYVRGEGGAVIVLKRLRDALDDGDRIYATIKGSAISHGGQASSLTAPNPEAQGALIVRAARDARVDGASIGYVEAHGTGTRLGDPIEVEGLKQAFAQFAAEGEAPACALASVKSNIGHLEGAAGIAGLIKAALCLRHRTLVPTLHFSRLNPEIDLGPALHVASTLTAWPARTDGAGRALPRRAGVSAFGFGGAMAHVILEEHAQAPRSGEPGGPYLFVLSAKNDAQLLATAGRVATFLERAGNQPGFSLAGLCYTLQVGREEMDERLAIVFDSRDELAGLLAAFTQGRAAGPTVYRGRRQAGRAQPAALQGRALHALAAAWVGGGAVDWRALYPGAAPQRIAVPGYAFARQRYWVARAPQAGQSAAVAAPARFNSVFSGHEAFLTDHRVNDRKVLPGVMYLELARAAAGAVAGQTGNALRISQVVWASPVFVDGAAVTVQTTVKRGGEERWSFEMRSGAGQADGLAAHLHAQGELALSHAEAPRIDLDARLRACGAGVLDAQRFYQGFAAIGIDYGPAHRGVTELRFGSDEVLARLAIGPESARDSGALFLHPGLLDSALQATYAFAIRAGQPTLMLPFVLDQVDVFGPCGAAAWALVRRNAPASGSASPSFDIDVCDLDGTVCVRMRGYRPKAPPASFGAAPAQGANLMLVPAWEPVAPSPVPAPAPSARTLIVGSLAGGARVLRERFPEAGKLPVRVGAGVDELAEALRRAGPIEHLVWAVPASAYRSMSDEALIEDQEQGVVFGLRLVQALLQLDYGARPLKWTVVTTQVCATRRNEPVAPGHASIHGLIGAMAKELPDWEVRLADVEANQAWPLDALLALPADPEGSPWAFRQGRWYRQQLVPTEAALDQDGIDLAEPYRHGGVYVVIGGAGGIGQAWSEFVAQRYQANIVWIGRTPADAAIEQKLDAVARRGPRPLYIAADARDRADLERAYRLIKARFPAIHGVVHSAIVLQDQSLATMSEQRLRAALSSKVDVSVRMAQVFGAEALDFAMFFSSIAAFTRVAGQSNYAAGCVFKDTFAHQLRQEWDCEVKVMNWGYWGTLGIAATPERTERMAREGIGSIRPDQAMDALTVLLSSAPDQMAFLTLAEAGEP